jgi:hypothetical protein
MHLPLAIAMATIAQFAQEVESCDFANYRFSCASVMELLVNFYSFLTNSEDFTKFRAVAPHADRFMTWIALKL